VAKYSALAMYMRRPPTSRGMPALGIAESLRDVTGAICSTASRIVCGPTEQLSPITSAPHASSARATSAGVAPYGVRRSTPTVICATTGIAGSTSRAARMACSISSRSPNVSRMTQSAPPVAQRGDLLAEERARLVAAVGRTGSMRTPERAHGAGDEHRPPRARRVGGLARQLGAAPVDRRHLRLQPVLRELEPVGAEVFVSSTSAPAATYSACTSRTSSGRAGTARRSTG
jgi:hypothetical protein